MTHRTQALLELRAELTELHKKIFSLTVQLEADIKNPSLAMTVEEHCDNSWVFEKLSELIKDLNTTINGMSEMSQQVAAMKQITAHINSESCPPIKGELATGTPNVKSRVKLPTLKGDRENYLKMMQYFGVSEDTAISDIFRLHWPKMCEYISERASRGLPLPPGLDARIYPIYSLSLRTKR